MAPMSTDEFAFRPRETRIELDDPTLLPEKFWRNAQGTVDEDEPTMQHLGGVRLASMRRRLVERFAEAGEDEELAVPIRRCRAASLGARRACWQGLCPVCCGSLGSWLSVTAAVAARKVMRARGRHDLDRWQRELAVITIAPTGRLTADEIGTSERYDTFVQRLHNVLDDANISLAMGALNVRVLRDRSSNWQAHYQVSVKAVVLRAEAEQHQLSRAVSTNFGTDPDRRRAMLVSVRELNDGTEPLSSLVSTSVETLNVTPTMRGANGGRLGGGRGLHLSTADELSPLLPVFSARGAGARVFLHGARIKLGNNGKAVVRATAPTLQPRRYPIADSFDAFDE